MHELLYLATFDINFQKKLKISPVDMIPHKSKSYRCILDLYFQIFLKRELFKSVNTYTNKKSKSEVMVQLGL